MRYSFYLIQALRGGSFIRYHSLGGDYLCDAFSCLALQFRYMTLLYYPIFIDADPCIMLRDVDPFISCILRGRSLGPSQLCCNRSSFSRCCPLRPCIPCEAFILYLASLSRDLTFFPSFIGSRKLLQVPCYGKSTVVSRFRWSHETNTFLLLYSNDLNAGTYIFN